MILEHLYYSNLPLNSSLDSESRVPRKIFLFYLILGSLNMNLLVFRLKCQKLSIEFSNKALIFYFIFMIKITVDMDNECFIFNF